jgi:hypothetical protein
MTDAKEYVIIILGPIFGFVLLSLCIRYTFYFCHGGPCPCIENNEPEHDELEHDAEYYAEYYADYKKYADNRLEPDVDEDRFDGFDNISI